MTKWANRAKIKRGRTFSQLYSIWTLQNTNIEIMQRILRFLIRDIWPTKSSNWNFFFLFLLGYSLFPSITQPAPGVYVTWLCCHRVTSPCVAGSALFLRGVFTTCLSRNNVRVQLLNVRTGEKFPIHTIYIGGCWHLDVK